MENEVRQLNPLTLAYIGDAIYEVHVREHLIQSGQTNPHELHGRAVKFVAAPAQAAIIHKWLADKQLTEAEEAIFRRGRNAKSGSIPKNASVQAYRYATGFEALVGFLYLTKNEKRLNELIVDAIRYVEKG